MSPELFKQSKNLFLVFPPGCGGNHVANMLSMNPAFEPRYTHDNYYESMVYQYEKFFADGPQESAGCTAHFSDLENLQKEELAEYTQKILNSERPYIFCSHAIEYLVGVTTKAINPFTDRIICLFTKPTGSNKLVNYRMRNRPWYHGEPDDQPYLTTMASKLYTIDTFSKFSDIDKDKMFIIDTDRFYSIDGYDYICEIFKTNLGIELPEVCRTMHTQYIQYAIALFPEVDN